MRPCQFRWTGGGEQDKIPLAAAVPKPRLRAGEPRQRLERREERSALSVRLGHRLAGRLAGSRAGLLAARTWTERSDGAGSGGIWWGWDRL